MIWLDPFGEIWLVSSDRPMEQVPARRYPGTPVLLMSGLGKLTPDYSGPFLPKPFTVDALLDAVGGLVLLPKA